MLIELKIFSSYQKRIFLKQVKNQIAAWDNTTPESVNAFVYFDGQHDEILAYDSDSFPNDPMTFHGFKCSACGYLIAEFHDWSGRDMEVDICYHCGQHYDYTDEELLSEFPDVLKIIKINRAFL